MAGLARELEGSSGERLCLAIGAKEEWCAWIFFVQKDPLANGIIKKDYLWIDLTKKRPPGPWRQVRQVTRGTCRHARRRRALPPPPEVGTQPERIPTVRRGATEQGGPGGPCRHRQRRPPSQNGFRIVHRAATERARRCGPRRH